MRTCKACKSPLSKRDDETPYNFSRRLHCDRKCGQVTSIAKRRGDRCATARLSTAEVTAIKRELRAGTKPASLAAEYGVSDGAIVSIKYGYNWRHVD